MSRRPQLLALFVLATLTGCAGMGASSSRLSAVLAPTQGNQARGEATFSETDGGVVVEVRVTGLAPGGHGFHVHDKGDCSAPDATSAGGHFNPTGKPHGHPDKSDHHLGDLPMLVADASGTAVLKTKVHGLSVSGAGAGNVAGRGLVIHAGPDDFSSQPAGNSGARVACGVISAK